MTTAIEEEYRVWRDSITDTPDLDTFMRWYEYDSNLVWRLDIGHLVNLLDEALTKLGYFDDRD